MSARFAFGAGEGEVMQLAWVVDDLDRAIDQRVTTLGIGPWFVFDHFELSDLTYRGEPSVLDISLALAFANGQCLELIQQHSDTPSVYRDLLGRGGVGFHHYGIGTRDYHGTIARYAAKGMELIVDGRVAAVGARAGYVEARRQLGAFIEIIEVNEPVNDLFRQMMDAAAEWDGLEPVRRL